MIRVVISDFGGVLTTPLEAGFRAYQQQTGVSIEQFGTALARAAEDDGEHPLFELERGAISEREFWSRIARHLDDSIDLNEMANALFDNMHANRRMIDYLRELRGRGLRLALLTNNVREWEARWRSKLPEIDELFEVVVDSAFVGMRKPEPAIYELTLQRLGGVPPQECAFVDDLEVNCVAASQLGMTAIRFEDSEQAIAALEEVLEEGPA